MAETRQHAELKRLAAAAGERLGWSARLEAPAVTPSGRRWVADVLLEKDGRRVAVEAQWSSQPADRYLERQRRYAEAGVEVVWLHRAERLEPSAAVVEGRVSEAPGGGYHVHLKGHPGQRLSVAAFVAAALEGSLRFGLREDDPVTLTVMAAEATCWHDACGARYRIIPTLMASLGEPCHLDPDGSQPNVGLLDAGDCAETRAALLATLAALGAREGPPLAHGGAQLSELRLPPLRADHGGPLRLPMRPRRRAGGRLPGAAVAPPAHVCHRGGRGPPGVARLVGLRGTRMERRCPWRPPCLPAHCFPRPTISCH